MKFNSLLFILLFQTQAFAGETALSDSFQGLKERVDAIYRFVRTTVADTNRAHSVSTNWSGDDMIFRIKFLDVATNKVSRKSYRTFYPQCKPGGECLPLAEELK